MSEMSGPGGSALSSRASPEAEASRIPVAFRRSRSMRLRGERLFPPCPAPVPSPPHSHLHHQHHMFPRIAESRESSAPGSSRGSSPPHTHFRTSASPRMRSLSLNLSQPQANGSAVRSRAQCSGSSISNSNNISNRSPSHMRQFPSKPSCQPNGRCVGAGSVSPATPPVSPEDALPEPDDDMESLHSYSSVATTASCDHAYVARNGTTFSGRKMKYVVHCSTHAGQTGEEYLTPTQRAQRQIRRLKALLNQAKMDLEKKDSDIFRLTKEVVELRLYKASLTSPDEKSNSSDAVTVKEITGDDIQTPDSPNLQDLTDDGPIKTHSDYSKLDSVDFKSNHLPSCSLNLSDLQSSLADSGHFEDMTASSVHSKDSLGMPTHDKACGVDLVDKEDDRLKLIDLYEKKIEDMTRKQTNETQEIKKMHNDRVEAILQKLADVNTRYSEMMPNYEEAKERIRDLERQLEQVSKQLAEQEEKHHKMYLQMYSKGQEAARFEQSNQDAELTHACSRVSVPELLEELQITQKELDNIRDLSYSPERMSSKTRILLSAKEAVSLWVLGARKAMYKRIVEAQAGSKKGVDPEVTLQFLKSAIYYFLTDRENHQGHLNAIESILGFTEAEKLNIQRARINN